LSRQISRLLPVLCLLSRIAMPVVAIGLNGNAWANQGDVNAVLADRVLRYEINATPCQLLSQRNFNAGRSRVRRGLV
jgi:hypothetical protein